MSQLTQSDFFHKYQSIYGFDQYNFTEDYMEDIYYDYKIDFYTHLEKSLLSDVEFDDEILNFNLMKTTIEECNESRVDKLLCLINDSLNRFELNEIKNFLQALFCWQSQFKNQAILLKIINFIENNLTHPFDFIKNIGNYSNKFKTVNTLMYAIHSNSIEMVRLVVENYGADLNFITNNGYTVLHYSILENNVDITQFLMNKIMADKNYIDFSNLLNMAINESLDCMINFLLDFYITNYIHSLNLKSEKLILSKKTCSNICKCLVFSEKCSTDTKSKIYKSIFQDFDFKLLMLDETLYLILMDSLSDKNLFQYLFEILQRQNKDKNQTQKILHQIIIKALNKINNSNWLNIIEFLLDHVDDKKELYDSINKSTINDVDKMTLISTQVCLDSKPKGYSSEIYHPYFLKQHIFIKYDIIPRDIRLNFFNYFMSQWVNICSLNKAYFSASSTIRYLTDDEIIKISLDYLSYLINYDFVNQSEIKNTLNNIRLINANKFDEYKSLSFIEISKKNSVNLKLICRNSIRQSLTSITYLKLKSLGLPDSLIEFIKGEKIN